jgi:integrase
VLAQVGVREKDDERAARFKGWCDQGGEGASLHRSPRRHRSHRRQPYVFTSTKRKGEHIDGIAPKVWKAILKEAKIVDLRVHDLRRTTASFWMNFGGLSIYEVSQQLNHKSIQTTKRYARLLDSTRIKKAEEGAIILDIFKKPKAA